MEYPLREGGAGTGFWRGEGAVKEDATYPLNKV